VLGVGRARVGRHGQHGRQHALGTGTGVRMGQEPLDLDQHLVLIADKRQVVLARKPISTSSGSRR
jgi:hypothetical protein